MRFDGGARVSMALLEAPTQGDKGDLTLLSKNTPQKRTPPTKVYFFK